MIESADNQNNINEALSDEASLPVTDAAVSEEAGSDAPNTGNGEAEEENGKGTDDGAVDYEALIREDTAVLREEFSERRDLKDITELENPLRYAALRDLGLSPVEAYLATARRTVRDNRSHLYSARTVSSSQKGVMPESELQAARDIFVGVSDADIRKLYRRVTK